MPAKFVIKKTIQKINEKEALNANWTCGYENTLAVGMD